MQDISTRTVQRIVRDATGLSPKSYARILQFHRALRLLRDHHMRPSEAASEAGYADQAHMTHALRDFGGLSPARLADVTLVTLGD
ncbi:helix-turn-helix protein [Shinella granuli]|jgi:AraC-like DNA-binding protein|uniref:Helix-turn-helix protein n=2 Tax=Shinella granuli TaxID=323621 RepID=A0A4R2C1U4_SHIGR|nr:helix-turn-helix protein [Shinella granuli]